MPDFIAPISWGLGDLIVSLPAVQGLIDRGRPTWLVTRSELQVGLAQRISGLAGTVAEGDLPSLLRPDDTYYNLRQHPIQTDYWWGSPEFERDFGGFGINDILALICSDLQIPADFDRLAPLIYEPKPEFSQTVVFLPGSDGSYKCWPTGHWQALRTELGRLRIDSVIVGEPDNSKEVSELVKAGLSWVPTPMLADALDVLSSCLAVVGVDTGLMHLSVQQGKPTIALFRQSRIYHRAYGNATALSGSPCDSECLRRSLTCSNNSLTGLSAWTPRTWSCAVADPRRCMAHITPEYVLASLQAMIGTARLRAAPHSISGISHGASR